MIPSAFHFLRPEWLLALFPAALIVALAAYRMRQAGTGGWATLVDAHLLRHLSVAGAAPRGSRAWVAALAAALVASVLAMAGPTWEKLPVPVYGSSEPTVIVLSLAQSMNGTDLVPSRLARAGHKLRDMLGQVKGGDVALVIYADRPFVAAPLTADAEVIRQMLPDLSTSLMPVLGNRLDLAITEARGLLTRAGAARGRIVVIADDAGLDPAASLTAAQAAEKAGYRLGVLGVGTVEGADLQTAQGRAITARDGHVITARLDVGGLTRLAQAGGGRFSLVTPDNRDISALLAGPSGDASAPGRPSDLVTDRWSDAGYLLLLVPVLLAPFAFRRGLLFALPLMLLSLTLPPTGVRAGALGNLLQTPDQQGQSAFEAGDYAAAAEAFTSADHKAAALYRAGEFDAAAQVYASRPGQESAPAQTYNLGNALARAGKFEAALATYDEVLAKTPDDADARFNRDLVAKLLEQQKQQQQQSDQDQEKSQPQNGEPEPDKGSDKQDDQKAGDQSGSQSDQAQESGKDGEQNSESGQDAGNETDTANAGPDQSEPGSEEQQNANPQQGEIQSAEQKQTGQPGEAKPKIGDVDATDRAAGTTPTQAGAAQPESRDQMPGSGTESGDATDQQQNDLKDLMDRMLAGNGSPAEPADKAPTAKGATQPLDQAAEQQLRAVPDDPSGLLRARIRQYYSHLRAAGQ